ncbi:MAG TPA: MarC family NAAT transporter [Alcaligenes sp.]|nr:MarC family NAAT transporter [Alcaligenes sp.]HRL26636.1 MarC family NAAT transporter [Alcaligenes sp.]
MLSELLLLIKLLGLGLAFLLPLANPLTSMALFLSLSESMSSQERQRQLRQATLYVFAALLVTHYAGIWIIDALSISMVDMRIAGGLIVAYIGFRMLFPTPISTVVAHAADQSNADNSIAFVPLTMPGTVGPGTMALIISASSKIDSLQSQYPQWMLLAAPPLLAALIALLFYVCLRSSTRIVKLIGHNGVDAISRIMGFLLVCMAVQLVLEGVQQYAASLLIHHATAAS